MPKLLPADKRPEAIHLDSLHCTRLSRRGDRRDVPAAWLWLWFCMLGLFISGCNPSPQSTSRNRPASDPKPPAGGTSKIASSAPSHHLRFEEQISRSGIDHQYDDGRSAEVFSIVESVGGGLAVCDFDQDGWFDLVYPGGGSFDPSQKTTRGLRGALYRGKEDWKFEDCTARAGIDMSKHYNHGVAAADYNSDGWVDLLVTGFTGLQLLENMGDGTFREVAAECGLNRGQAGTSAGWADFNGDGHLDLYVTSYTNWSFDNDPPCIYPGKGRDLCGPREFGGADDVLYLSEGDGRFRDASKEFGILDEGRGLGVLAADWNDDRMVDLLVANDEEPNRFYMNRDGKSFREMGTKSGVALDESGSPDGNMGLALGDFNRDGKFDIFVTHYETETSALYRNTGRMNFVHAARLANVTCYGNMFVSWGTAFVDFDLDADEDLILVNGHVLRRAGMAPLDQLPIALENQNGKTFQNASPTAGDFFQVPRSARGLIVADFDHDGLPDVATSNILQPHSLLRNVSQRRGHWLGIRLIGTSSNRDAIGTIVIVKSGDLILARQVYGGGSYASTSDRTLMFGLGDHEVDSVEIRWPSGRDDRLASVELDRVSIVVEGP